MSRTTPPRLLMHHVIALSHCWETLVHGQHSMGLYRRVNSSVQQTACGDGRFNAGTLYPGYRASADRLRLLKWATRQFSPADLNIQSNAAGMQRASYGRGSFWFAFRTMRGETGAQSLSWRFVSSRVRVLLKPHCVWASP
jgi:hypothetical protein